MKRLAGHLALMLAVIMVESILPGIRWLQDVRPVLHVPLVLFFALKLNTIEGAILSYMLGFMVDVTVPYDIGLAQFADVSIFVIARVVLAGIKADGAVVEVIFSFLLTALFHFVTWGLRRLLGLPMTPLANTNWLQVHLIACAGTAALTPYVFRIGKRIELWRPRQPGALA